jgi:hypothetical protein
MGTQALLIEGRYPRHPTPQGSTDVCCKWRFSMRTPDDPEYVKDPGELTKKS